MAQTREYGLGPHTFPRGWFMVGESADATPVPKPVRFFGEELVLYRGESGKAFLVEAYCAHLGAHLARNTTSYVVRDGLHVEGDCIRCPYHAWRYGADGRCNEIPYSKGPIPPAARIRSWRLEERYGCLFTWYDPEGLEPNFDLPHIGLWDDPAYVHWTVDALGTLPCHPIEIIDNMADVAHLGPTHGGPAEYFHNEIDGIVCRQRQGAGHRNLAKGYMLETDTFYTGPGILLSYFNADMGVMFIAHTPVEDGVVRAWHAFLAKSQNVPIGEADVAAARAAQAGSLAAFAQDFEIWTYKRPCLKPLAVAGDGSFAKVRAWYRQFYNERARAPEFHALANGVFPVRGMPTTNPRAA